MLYLRNYNKKQVKKTVSKCEILGAQSAPGRIARARARARAMRPGTLFHFVTK